VTLVEGLDRLVPREDPRISELILAALTEEGIDVHLGVRAEAVGARDGERVARLTDGTEVFGHELLVAVGRAPRVNDIGLRTVGIQPDPRGISIDERCRAAAGVWAIGDVTGVMPFTHVGMYQGRLVAADIAGRDVRADHGAPPRVIFSDPEIAAVGLGEQQAREQGNDIATSRVSLPDAIARPGRARAHRRPTARGPHRSLDVAPPASEWIHQAALAIKAQIPLEVLKDTVAQFPTFSEAHLKGVEALDLA
jgi:pyruvate/2-oxoglutarate dehydrogenase complex dihydrolipoamide dehydrogenase (E3) component